METALKLLFSPMVFAMGFLWPLVSQALVALEAPASTSTAWIIGAVVAFVWGAMAQWRGSWIWIK